MIKMILYDSALLLMRYEGMRKRLNNKWLLGYWQLVAPVWNCVALKYDA
jgi:hypothetical protein